MKMQNIRQRVTAIPNNCVCEPVLETKNKKIQLMNNKEFYILKKTTLLSNFKCTIKNNIIFIFYQELI